MAPVTIPRLTPDPRPVWTPGVREPLREPHADARPDGAVKPDQRRRRMRGPAGAAAAKIGASVESVPSISPTSPG